MAKRLYLVRHGSTGVEGDGRFRGAGERPLDELGRRQAQAAATWLADRTHADVLFCSPQQRTREMAEIIGNGLRLSPQPDADLREVDFGRWEGRTFDEIVRQDATLVERWSRLDPDFTFPDGERLETFIARAIAAADRAARSEAETVVVVTHGGVIRMMLCHLLRLPQTAYLAFELPPASIAELKLFDGMGVLVELTAARA